MKLIIAGSRDIYWNPDIKEPTEDQAMIDRIMAILSEIHESTPITEVVSGCAQGADELGEIWAMDNNIPIKKFPANWKEYGKAAGVIRNKEMAKYADRAILFWDGYSKGTLNMKQTMEKMGKPCRVIVR